MKIFIANDHAGLVLKKQIMEFFHEVSFTDLGCYDENRVDYPDYANKLCLELLENKSDKGILICGTGIGMSIAANRHKHIRAALCYDLETAMLARKHNDANILVLGSRVILPKKAIECIKIFLETNFENGYHLARINKL